jgi:hypothetical protein
LPPKISKSKEEKAEDRAIKIAHLCLNSHLSPSLPIHPHTEVKAGNPNIKMLHQKKTPKQ